MSGRFVWDPKTSASKGRLWQKSSHESASSKQIAPPQASRTTPTTPAPEHSPYSTTTRPVGSTTIARLLGHWSEDGGGSRTKQPFGRLDPRNQADERNPQYRKVVRARSVENQPTLLHAQVGSAEAVPQDGSELPSDEPMELGPTEAVPGESEPEQTTGNSDAPQEEPTGKSDEAPAPSGAKQAPMRKPSGELSEEEEDKVRDIYGRHLHYKTEISVAKSLLSRVSETELQDYSQLLGPRVASDGLRLRSKLLQALLEFKAACRDLLRHPHGQTREGEERIDSAVSNLHSCELDYSDFLSLNRVEDKLRCEKAITNEKINGTYSALSIIGLSMKYAGIKQQIKKVDTRLNELLVDIENNESNLEKAGFKMVGKSALSLLLGFLKKGSKTLKRLIFASEVLFGDNPKKEIGKEIIGEGLEYGLKKGATKAGATEHVAEQISQYGGLVFEFLVDFEENWTELDKACEEFKITHVKLYRQIRHFNAMRLELVGNMHDISNEVKNVITQYNKSLGSAKNECSPVDGGYQNSRSKVHVPGFDF